MHEQMGMGLGKISYEPQKELQLKRWNALVYSQSNGACPGSIIRSDLPALSRHAGKLCFTCGSIHRSQDEGAELRWTHIRWEEYTYLREALKRAESIGPKNRLA